MNIEDSSDFMNTIISEANDKVNNFISNVSNDLQESAKQINFPDIMQDYIFTDTPKPHFFERIPKENKQSQDITEINKTFVQLKEKAEVGSLDDSFRTKNIKEIRSETERSFKKTIDSFSRYYSILQASH